MWNVLSEACERSQDSFFDFFYLIRLLCLCIFFLLSLGTLSFRSLLISVQLSREGCNCVSFKCCSNAISLTHSFQNRCFEIAEQMPFQLRRRCESWRIVACVMNFQEINLILVGSCARHERYFLDGKASR